LAGCADRGLAAGAAADGAAADLALPTDAGNACDRGFGYCAPHDVLTCMVGFAKSPVLTMQGACGGDICCVPLEH
jgi:hypothetical protein